MEKSAFVARKPWSHSRSATAPDIEAFTPRRAPRSKRFALAVSYWEKITMGTINLHSLLQFANEWGAEVTLPFAKGPRLIGWPENSTSNENYSLIYDIAEIQRNLLQLNLSRLVDFYQFYRIAFGNNTARTQIIFIKINYNNQRPSVRYPLLVECGKNFEFAKNLKINSVRLNTPHYSCCKLESKVPTTPQDIASGCGFKNLDEYVIIFKEWHGITIPDPKRLFRLSVPKEFINKHPLPPTLELLPLSQFVVQSAYEFLTEKLGKQNTKNFIAVHIRAEKIHLRHRQTNETKCILDTIKLAKGVGEENPNITKTLYFTDYLGIKLYKELFVQEGIEITSFRSTEAQNEAFVAQVEAKVMSQAKLLIVSGGGSFQKIIVERYMMSNETSLVFKVKGCMDP
uniref:Peptide-O-fucosyltransferase n=1 Tax=Amphimedon queenslandica TaxID=400682 RepID=A0A1X7VXA6_AMPQE